MTTQNVEDTLKQAGGRVGEAAGGATRAGWTDVQRVLEYDILKVAGLEITVGGVLAAVVVIAATWLLSVLLRHALKRYSERNDNANRATVYTLSRVLHYILLALGLLIALDVAGIPVGKLTIFAGALGVGLGFGLQAIFSNFVSGLILLFDRSLKVGDFVELESGVHGEVCDIKIRATRIATNDNIDILVPNSEFVTGRVVNWTLRDGSRRVRIPFGVAYGTPKEQVKLAALEAAAEVPFTSALEGKRKPQVWLVEFGDSSLNFELVVWLTADATKRPSTVKAAYLWALHTALEKYDIEIPFPQQDLHLRSLFGLTGKDALAALNAKRVKRVQDKSAAVQTGLVGDALSTNDALVEVEEQIAMEMGEAVPDAAHRNAQKHQEKQGD